MSMLATRESGIWGWPVCQKKMTRMSGIWSSGFWPGLSLCRWRGCWALWIPCTGLERERAPPPQTTFPELSPFSLECAWFGMKSGKNLRMLDSAKIFTSASRKIFPRRTDLPVLNCGRWCRRPEGGGSVRTWKRAMCWLTTSEWTQTDFAFYTIVLKVCWYLYFLQGYCNLSQSLYLVRFLIPAHLFC